MTTQPAQPTPQEPVRFGAYTLEKRISIGGAAELFRAEHRVTRRIVALRRYLPHVNEDVHVRAMARDALMPLRALAPHPNVVSVLDVGVVDETLYVALELVDAPTLADLTMLARKRGGATAGQLPIVDVISAAIALGRGLAHVHAAGFVHRNISAHKLLGAKLLGTGVPPWNGSGSAGSVFGGNARYFAPEQVRGDVVDARVDQWSTAMTLWQALVGRLPFDASSTVETLRTIMDDTIPIPAPSSLRKDVPRALDAAIMRALSRDPAKRFPDMNTFVAALGATGEP